MPSNTQQYSCLRTTYTDKSFGWRALLRKRTVIGLFRPAFIVLLGCLTGFSPSALGQKVQKVPLGAITKTDFTSINTSGNVFLTANVLGVTASGATSVATGDFNGDGKMDIVAPIYGNAVNVFLGNGDGTFQAPKSFAVSCNPAYVTVADFNGDGKADLAVSAPGCSPGTNAVTIFLGNGDGTFTAKTSLTASISNPFSSVAGDFNGDGKMDLAVVDRGSSTDSVIFFFGNGDGTFQAPVSVSLGGLADSNQIVAADFNKDGHLDVAVSQINAANVVVILGNGNGTFQAPRNFALPGQGFGLAVGDFNGDGVPDLVATNPAIGGVTVLLGTGNGNFTAVNNPQTGTTPTAYAAIPDGGCQPIAVADFNKDGKADVIAGLSGVNGSAAVAVLLGNGDGTLQTELLYDAVDFPTALAVADFNGDGNPDWVTIGNQTSWLAVSLGRGDGTFLAADVFDVGLTPVWAAVSDFNNDGILDVVVANQAQGSANGTNTAVLLGKGDGTFQPPLNLNVVGMTPIDIVSGDFNGDGKQDFIVLDSGGGFVAPCYGTNLNCLSVFLGNGDGTFQTPTVIGTGSSGVAGIITGDFNGDGKLDLAMIMNPGGPPMVGVLLGNGDGTFKALTPFSTGGSSIAVMKAASLRNNGTLDLVVTDYLKGQVEVFLGNGDGTFQAPTALAAGRYTGGMAIADFNGDGKLDIVVDNELDQTAEIYLGNGDGTFNTPTLFGIGSGNAPGVMVAGDFNLDGHLDIAISHQNSDIPLGLTLVLGNGDGTFQAPQDYLISREAFVVAVDDFNRDGAPDLLLIDTADQLMSVLLNQTPPPIIASPRGLNFGDQLVGTASSPPLMIQVNNNGAVAATVSATVSGDFSQTNTCPVSPATLGAGKNCAISVIFKPTATGVRNGNVTVSDSLPGSPQIVALTGAGVEPIATLGSPSISFGNQIVGTSSAPMGVSLTNTGTAPLASLSVTITGANSGDYSQTNNCSASLAIGALCNIQVTFKPTATGARAASVSISDDAANNPQSVPLTGTGVAPVVTLSAPLSFTSQPVGTSSTPQNVTVMNSGNAPLTLSSIVITGANSGDFSQTNNCPPGTSTLAAGLTCTIVVTFTPTATGPRAASVTITDDAGNSPQNVSLTGTGAPDSPVAGLSTTSVPFGNQLLGTSSMPQKVTLTNTGNVTLTIASISVTGANSGDFAQTNNCGASVAVNAACTINVTFTPAALGARTASLTLTDNASGSPQNVSLTGTGVAPAVTLSANTLSFNGQLITTTSAPPQVVTITNSGTAPLDIASIVINGSNSSDFAQTNNCPAANASLAPSAKCTVNITFTPAVVDNRTASLSITDNASGSPHAVALSGTGTDFSLAAASGNNCPQNGNCSTSSTISAGQTATYNLQVSPIDGFSGLVALNCTGAPASTTCAVSPASVPPNGSASYAFSVSVSNTTNARYFPVSRTPRVPFIPGLVLSGTLVSLLALLGLKLGPSNRVRLVFAPAMAILLLGIFYMSGCGGGPSGPPPPPPPTNAVLMITGTSSTVNHSVSLNLTINH